MSDVSDDTMTATAPRHTRRRSDKILIAFHQACDLADFEAAERLLRSWTRFWLSRESAHRQRAALARSPGRSARAALATSASQRRGGGVGSCWASADAGLSACGPRPCLPMLQRCSSSPRRMLLRSAPSMSSGANSRLRSSCGALFPAITTTRRHGSAPGPSPAGSRCHCGQ